MPKVIDDGQVFRAVLQLLVAVGYKNTTTAQIADAAQIHESTLFRKYGTKVDLIRSAVAHGLAETPYSQVTYTGELREDLLAIVRAYVETNAQFGEVVSSLLVQTAQNPELRDWVDILRANNEPAIRVIAQHQAQGALRHERPQETVLALIAPLMVQQMMRRAAGGDSPPPVDLDAHVDAFLEGRQRFP